MVFLRATSIYLMLKKCLGPNRGVRQIRIFRDDINSVVIPSVLILRRLDNIVDKFCILGSFRYLIEIQVSNLLPAVLCALVIVDDDVLLADFLTEGVVK